MSGRVLYNPVGMEEAIRAAENESLRARQACELRLKELRAVDQSTKAADPEPTVERWEYDPESGGVVRTQRPAGAAPPTVKEVSAQMIEQLMATAIAAADAPPDDAPTGGVAAAADVEAARLGLSNTFQLDADLARLEAENEAMEAKLMLSKRD
eukprot:4856043-Prymnesium_polylepis.1